MNLDQQVEITKKLRTADNVGSKIGLVSGNFNVVHPGHLRLLKFAADCCDTLVVAIHSDENSGVLVPSNLRLESISAISYVKHAFVFDGGMKAVINAIRPDIIIKGKEHQELENIEQDFLAEYGGKLVFGSGEAVFSSLDLIREESIRRKSSPFDLKVQHKYLERHGIKKDRLYEILDKFSDISVLVVGDLIVDEYITCDVLGLSQEDPIVVVTPVLEQKFIGGAGIVASHAKGLGAQATYLSVCGDDSEYHDSMAKFENYGVTAKIFKDPNRPTTLKQRFRASGKTLFRVSKLKQHAIETALQNKIFEYFESKISEFDLVIFSDFNYGVLPQNLIDRLTELCKKLNIPMVADSQSSSQKGNIARFKDMLLITPTENEARIALQDYEDGLVGVADALMKKSNPKQILLTLGAEGVLIQKGSYSEDLWMTDRIPALCVSPKDPAGAGDAMLVSSSLALIAGATIWEAAYIGSIASGCQVSTVGNIPLGTNEIRQEISMLPEG